ncbi:hypothetical protein [Alicyclobacillus sp. ALC3]|uniref:hypothetical protein n=1 Tax=Alicyclobacillus sp. ALC3 TaxID=2796143 RepID=UPI0023780A83|nr:hypothetical protein [Alicyclobacillus sp. ALC3]WDL95803.1 hypothetical protein JC200_15760 [Alicyclobacillus sp. ALC3]
MGESKDSQHSLHGSEHTPVDSKHGPLGSEHTPVDSKHGPLGSEHTPLDSEHTPVAPVHTLQDRFAERLVRSSYPLYPYHGSVTRYQDVSIKVPEQRQFQQPGHEAITVPRPLVEHSNYKGSGGAAGGAAAGSTGSAKEAMWVKKHAQGTAVR